jgi:hypothetical protein
MGVYFLCCLSNCKRASNLGSTTTIYDTIILHKISYNAKRIVKSPFCFVYNLDYQLNMRRENTILLLPRTKTVTARVLAHSSITSILSRVVPNSNSRTSPARPSFSGDKSSNLGTIRPFVAMAINYSVSRFLHPTYLDFRSTNPSDSR